jgi:phosphoglucomutase
MALYHLSQGKSVMDRLEELYDQFGYYEETQVSRYFEGSKGKDVMAGLMKRLRSNPPSEIGGVPVAFLKDYQDGTTRDVAGNSVKKDIHLPSSNVLQFLLSDQTVVSARPSGTEPKIKFYASVTERRDGDNRKTAERVQSKIQKIELWIDEQISTVGAK